MKGIMKSKKLIGLAVILGLIISVFPLSTAMAAGLTVTDTMSSSTTSAASKHTIGFTATGGVPSGGKIAITFAKSSSFSGVSGIVTGDLVMTAGGSSFTTFTASGLGQVLTIVTSGAISSSAAVVIDIGDGSGGGLNDISNPSTPGTYSVNVITKNSSGGIVDNGYVLKSIGAGTAASATVKEYISMTISDSGASGVNFGDLEPNISNNPDLDQDTGSTTPSVTLTVGSETNVIVDLQLSQDSSWFSGVYTEYSVGSYTASPSLAYTTSAANITGGTGKTAGQSVKLYHYLDVPAGAAAGTITKTLTYQAVAA